MASGPQVEKRGKEVNSAQKSGQEGSADQSPRKTGWALTKARRVGKPKAAQGS